MKKILTTLLLVLSASLVALAVPANPAKYKYTQPDGTVIVLQNHGDEHFHWTTDANGRIVEKGEDGFYRPVASAVHEARRRAALGRPRPAAWSSYETAPETNFGDRKILCIIANFTDSTFVIDNPRESFSNMLNQEGYSANGAIGSVRDYYIDNSMGQYRPQFDVYGPVTLTESSAHYDASGVRTAILEAYELLAGEINIDDYDTDGDGDVDMVLFYYPGHNEAEGAGSESIWPHQSSGNFGTMGSKTFNRYFCTSELRGSRGSEMCAIGTTCHEFAHSLGLPDFYDTDYSTSGENGFTTGKFDLMSAGNYNDSGRRPPYLNALERNMLGWMEAPAALDNGQLLLAPVRGNIAYSCVSATENEYFLFEVRDNYKWDSALSDYGLLVYHVDKSERIVAGSTTAAALWNGNKINAYGGHPCFYTVPSSDGVCYAFPGSGSVSSFLPTDWDGNESGVMLSSIAFDGSNASFKVTLTTSRMMFGNVYDTFGHPIEGAQVVLSQAAHPFAAAPAMLSGDRSVMTDADGYYEFVLPESASSDQILTVRKSGYTPVSMNVPVAGTLVRQHFYLPREGEGEHADLMRYDSSLSFYSTTFGVESIGIAFKYTADELAAMGAVGSIVESVSFRAAPTTYEKIYVVIDIGGEKKLLREVTDSFAPGAMTKVYVGDAGITIPEGADVFIGYGMTGLAGGEHNVNMYGPQETFTEGSYAIIDFMEGTNWSKINFGGSYFSFIVSAELSKPAEIGFANYGVASVRLSEGVPEVVAPAAKTVYAVQWYLDGVPVESPVALSTLAAGTHTYMVRLSYYDGTSERVYYEFTR